MDHGVAQVGGTLDAPAAQGDGGFIETSAPTVKVAFPDERLVLLGLSLSVDGVLTAFLFRSYDQAALTDWIAAAAAQSLAAARGQIQRVSLMVR